jgi:hypothetical protein
MTTLALTAALWLALWTPFALMLRYAPQNHRSMLNDWRQRRTCNPRRTR